MQKSWYRPLIEQISKEFGLDPLLVEAISWQESLSCADAFRFEPKFWLRYQKHLPEYKGANPRRVSASYGLMQVMYQTAKEAGFVGDPEELFIPAVNVFWSCGILKKLTTWAKAFATSDETQLQAVLASYNGGRGGNKPTDQPLRNGRYAAAVLSIYRQLKG